MWAAEDKRTDATRLLVEKGANVHQRDLVCLLKITHTQLPLPVKS